MRIPVLFLLAVCPCGFAQAQGNSPSQTAPPVSVFVDDHSQTASATGSVSGNPKSVAVERGAPYSATITTESIQTLADGNRIVARTAGFVARDSLGRIRQEMELPPIGNLSAASTQRMVFIQDPVANVSYTLNVTDKTAYQIPLVPGRDPSSAGTAGGHGTGVPGAGRRSVTRERSASVASKDMAFLQKRVIEGEAGRTTSSDLGSQLIEGMPAQGTRTILTIPAGQIGNDYAISVITDVWTSTELKAIVYSKRTDPRTGKRTFRLTNIDRGEPQASLFKVPPDFTLIDSPNPVVYRPK